MGNVFEVCKGPKSRDESADEIFENLDDDNSGGLTEKELLLLQSTQEKREYWRQKFKENARLQKSRFRAIYKEECAGLTDDQFKKRYEEDLANAKKVDAKFEKVGAKSEKVDAKSNA
mmetsp:Transcript_9499/g.11351  ORF Transcript_9499/g.11351 Transcript_9499/m.11351 type:complete len:117 (+) Transcript_9499:66-416(+)|eukprot:jgi/Bigna1/64800/fgenesh1_kg.85_\